MIDKNIIKSPYISDLEKTSAKMILNAYLIYYYNILSHMLMGQVLQNPILTLCISTILIW